MNLFEIITGQIGRMSYVNRYSSYPANRRENVAEHSWWVAFIAYLIALDLRSQGEQVDLEQVLCGAVTHDISEVISGDVIRSYKHANPEIRDAMKRADYDNTEEMTADWPAQVFDDWHSAKTTSLAGEIVEFADQAAVMFYCREEDRSGNRAIRAVLKQAYETWFNKFHAHPQLGQYINQMFPGGRFFDMLREYELPAQRMFAPARPMMADHSEGKTGELPVWPTREVPLG
jgi:5'-deoxynucleotidase